MTDAAIKRHSIPSWRIGLALGLDIGSILLFVGLGRRTHDQDPGLGGLLSTAAPFLIALGIGWGVTRNWRRPISIPNAIAIWAITLAVGMATRMLVFDRTAAFSFVLVTAAMTAALLIGWRLVFAVVERRVRADS